MNDTAEICGAVLITMFLAIPLLMVIVDRLAFYVLGVDLGLLNGG